MANVEYPAWQKPYQDALLELDPEKLRQKIEAAENAIFLRMQELPGFSDHDEEREAIHDAVDRLCALQIETLHYPKLPGESGDNQYQ